MPVRVSSENSRVVIYASRFKAIIHYAPNPVDCAVIKKDQVPIFRKVTTHFWTIFVSRSIFAILEVSYMRCALLLQI